MFGPLAWDYRAGLRLTYNGEHYYYTRAYFMQQLHLWMDEVFAKIKHSSKPASKYPKSLYAFLEAAATLKTPQEADEKIFVIGKRKIYCAYRDNCYMRDERLAEKFKGRFSEDGPSYKQMANFIASPRTTASDSMLAKSMIALLSGSTDYVEGCPVLPVLMATLFIADPARNPAAFLPSVLLLDLIGRRAQTCTSGSYNLMNSLTQESMLKQYNRTCGVSDLIVLKVITLLHLMYRCGLVWDAFYAQCAQHFSVDADAVHGIVEAYLSGRLKVNPAQYRSSLQLDEETLCAVSMFYQYEIRHNHFILDDFLTACQAQWSLSLDQVCLILAFELLGAPSSFDYFSGLMATFQGVDFSRRDLDRQRAVRDAGGDAKMPIRDPDLYNCHKTHNGQVDDDEREVHCEPLNDFDGPIVDADGYIRVEQQRNHNHEPLNANGATPVVDVSVSSLSQQTQKLPYLDPSDALMRLAGWWPMTHRFSFSELHKSRKLRRIIGLSVGHAVAYTRDTDKEKRRVRFMKSIESHADVKSFSIFSDWLYDRGMGMPLHISYLSQLQHKVVFNADASVLRNLFHLLLNTDYITEQRKVPIFATDGPHVLTDRGFLNHDHASFSSMLDKAREPVIADVSLGSDVWNDSDSSVDEWSDQLDDSGDSVDEQCDQLNARGDIADELSDQLDEGDDSVDALLAQLDESDFTDDESDEVWRTTTRDDCERTAPLDSFSSSGSLRSEIDSGSAEYLPSHNVDLRVANCSPDGTTDGESSMSSSSRESPSSLFKILKRPPLSEPVSGGKITSQRGHVPGSLSAFDQRLFAPSAPINPKNDEKDTGKLTSSLGAEKKSYADILRGR